MGGRELQHGALDDVVIAGSFFGFGGEILKAEAKSSVAGGRLVFVLALVCVRGSWLWELSFWAGALSRTLAACSATLMLSRGVQSVGSVIVEQGHGLSGVPRTQCGTDAGCFRADCWRES